MRGDWAVLGFVELIDELVESIGVWQPIALADVGAEELAEGGFGLRRDLDRLAARIAEPRKLAAFAQVQQVPPDFAVRRLGVLDLRGIRRV